MSIHPLETRRNTTFRGRVPRVTSPARIAVLPPVGPAAPSNRGEYSNYSILALLFACYQNEWEGNDGVPEHNLLFKCRKCGWWAIGTHNSESNLEREDLNSAQFDVKCTSEECGWSGQLQGSDSSTRSSETNSP